VGVQLGVLAEPFDEPFEVRHPCGTHLEHGAVPAGQPVNLDDPREVLGLRGLEQTAVQHATHLDERRERQADRRTARPRAPRQ
jgi:hypothetical protein